MKRLLILSAIGATAATALAAAAPATEPKIDPALARFYGQRLVWKSCGQGLDCAKARVPLDYAKPAGRTIKLALTRIRATGAAKRVGTLFFDPGGPGTSGSELLKGSIGQVLSAGPGKAFDIVGLDPRGVGASTPLDCLTDKQLDGWLFSRPAAPTTPAAKKAYLGWITTFAKGCQRRSGALAGHVSTVEVAKDLDMLRALVGDRKLNYLGWSYGTKIGSVYAQLFPKRVGRMVLDGPEHPRLTGVEAQRSQLAGYEIALRSFIKSCVAKGACPLGTSKDAGMQTLRSLIDRLAGRPLPTADPTRPLTDSRALYGIVGVIGDPDRWPRLSLALGNALQGDGAQLGNLGDSFFERQASGRYERNGNLFEANTAVKCLDSASRRGSSVAEKAVSSFRRISAVFGPLFAWDSAVCESWPIRATNPQPVINPVGAPPILVVGTTRDPATPYSQAVALAKALKTAVLLTRVGDGHLAYLAAGNACIDAAVNRFLLTGKPPAAGTRCK